MKTNKNLIIVWGDGGICSQIGFYSVGLYLMNKGFDVKFDLNFFKNNAKDCIGRFDRNFDLQKAFPNIVVNEASLSEIKYYKKHYPKRHNNLSFFKPPLYLNGWAPILPFLVQNRHFFIDNFQPVDVETCHTFLSDIQKHNSCGVHIRRGDLANSTEGVYGYPCSVNYFSTAINILSKLEKNIKFYFFSDEPEYVKKEILPTLSKDINYQLCDSNGSDKGYLDLYLLSKCRHIIASKGSFGAFARILSNSDGWFIGTLKSSYLAEYFDKCIFLNYDKEKFIKYEESFPKFYYYKKLKKLFINMLPIRSWRKKLRKKYHV